MTFTLSRWTLLLAETLLIFQSTAIAEEVLWNPASKYKTHPMIYFSPADVPLLRQQAVTTHRHITQLLKDGVEDMLNHDALPPKVYEEFAADWNEDYGNNLTTLAFYCLLHPSNIKAREFAIEYMDRMAALPNWQVISMPNVDLPTAHSAIGFVSAFDFLFNVLDTRRQKLYLDRILVIIEYFIDIRKKRWWGQAYLQNHIATNYLALIHAALVAEVHFSNVSSALDVAVKELEATMFLLNQIVDGSLDEGVYYGSYTSRSLTQYIHLGLRHFDLDHTNDTWWHEHFNFYYYTILSGFQKSIGIGDSGPNWAYGPQSQLVFLDKFILRNGYGNWLASEIRRQSVPSNITKTLCTLHTEFLWYDPTITATPPHQNGEPSLHTFSDWGVVTFGTFLPGSATHDTFLSFKSSKMHGRAVFDIVKRSMYKSWITGWKNFNPGHEHPDQNSFVFAPNGNVFISDNLYSQKLTYLNNVLTFSPSSTSNCNQPWEGQLGECFDWLKYKNPEVANYSGELVTAVHQQEMVFVSGEAVSAYHNSMKLHSVYRAMTLLSPHLLLVIDHVELKKNSLLKFKSAFFHNTEHWFHEDELRDELHGAKIKVNLEDYRMFWINSKGNSPKSTIKINPHTSLKRDIDTPTNFVNVTWPLGFVPNRMAYVLASPKVTVNNLRFTKDTTIGTTVVVETTDKTYHVAIATKHDDPTARCQYLGFIGHASVKTSDGKLVSFGLDPKTLKTIDTCVSPKAFKLACILTVIIWLFTSKRCTIRHLFYIKIVSHSVLFLSIYVLCKVILGNLGVSTPSPELPITAVSSLPVSGAELVSQLFQGHSDFIYIPVPSDTGTTKRGINSLVNLCPWKSTRENRPEQFTTWIQDNATIVGKDRLLLETAFGQNVSMFSRDHDEGSSLRWSFWKLNKTDTNVKYYTLRMFQEHMDQYPKALPVFQMISESWALNIPLLRQTFGTRFRSLHVVRDPRAWVSTALREYSTYLVNIKIELEEMFNSGDCVPGSIDVYYNQLKIETHKDNVNIVRVLALLWAAHTSIALRNNRQLSKDKHMVVKFEDIVREPKKIGSDIYKMLGMALPPSMEHQILQATRSGVYGIPYTGIIDVNSMNSWQYVLSTRDVKDIESICKPVMEMLNYSELTF